MRPRAVMPGLGTSFLTDPDGACAGSPERTHPSKDGDVEVGAAEAAAEALEAAITAHDDDESEAEAEASSVPRAVRGFHCNDSWAQLLEAYKYIDLSLIHI